MAVKVQLLGTKFPECQEDACPHRKTCANHNTAGDHRSEGGLTPDLKQNRNGDWVCSQTPKAHDGARLADGSTTSGDDEHGFEVEYKTTGGSFRWTNTAPGRVPKLEADSPISPDGDEWRMVGSAASGDTILWFWERDI